MDTGPLPENSTIVRRTVITRYLDADGELCMQLEANDGHEVEGESQRIDVTAHLGDMTAAQFVLWEMSAGD
ncbi:hypothetical protein SEA_YAGO84_66 [Gordonia phage Yago84]|nr:hypothetical protein SEA_YAGO84_66 [Gordonia phage Yago84]